MWIYLSAAEVRFQIKTDYWNGRALLLVDRDLCGKEKLKNVFSIGPKKKKDFSWLRQKKKKCMRHVALHYEFRRFTNKSRQTNLDYFYFYIIIMVCDNVNASCSHPHQFFSLSRLIALHYGVWTLKCLLFSNFSLRYGLRTVVC